MPTIEAFFSAIKTVVSLGATSNATNRLEIRKVVSTLADELDRALTLADAYLAGASFVHDKNELKNYLIGAYPKIMQDFSEYKVCASLYQLADEFSQVFNAKRLSVSVSALGEVPELIRYLKDGERAVIDSLDALLTKVSDLGVRLSAATARQAPAVRREIETTLLGGRSEIAGLKKRIKSLSRQVVDKL
jgi:hypothetical protein